MLDAPSKSDPVVFPTIENNTACRYFHILSFVFSEMSGRCHTILKSIPGIKYRGNSPVKMVSFLFKIFVEIFLSENSNYFKMNKSDKLAKVK